MSNFKGAKWYTRDINEFIMLEQYLERWGATLVAVRYYSEGFALTTAAPTFYVGVKEGFQPKYTYFFGNVMLRALVTGAVVLANANYMNLKFMTDLPQVLETNYLDKPFAVGVNLNLMGNGEYIGSSRIYQAGFNRLDLEFTGWGAAVPTLKAHLNGYLLITK